MNVQIIKPNTQDIEALIPLWIDQYDYHQRLDPEYYVENSEQVTDKFREYLQKSISDTLPHILVAKLNDDFIGFITFDILEADYFDTNITKYGSIIEVFVNDDYRRNGIGTQLMKAAENEIRKTGVEWIELQSSSFNDTALKFYNGMNYKIKQVLLYKKIED